MPEGSVGTKGFGKALREEIRQGYKSFVWSERLGSEWIEVNSLIPYKGSLYASFASKGEIWRFIDEWSLVYTVLTADAVGNRGTFWGREVFKDKLYFGGMFWGQTPVGGILVYDGSTWREIRFASAEIGSLAYVGNDLFAGTYGTPSSLWRRGVDDTSWTVVQTIPQSIQHLMKEGTDYLWITVGTAGGAAPPNVVYRYRVSTNTLTSFTLPSAARTLGGFKLLSDGVIGIGAEGRIFLTFDKGANWLEVRLPWYEFNPALNNWSIFGQYGVFRGTGVGLPCHGLGWILPSGSNANDQGALIWITPDMDIRIVDMPLHRMCDVAEFRGRIFASSGYENDPYYTSWGSVHVFYPHEFAELAHPVRGTVSLWGGPTAAKAIGVNETSPAFPGMGNKKTISFNTNTPGTLTIQVDPYGRGVWYNYDTVIFAAAGFTVYPMPTDYRFIRLMFSAAANVHAWVGLT